VKLPAAHAREAREERQAARRGTRPTAREQARMPPPDRAAARATRCI